VTPPAGHTVPPPTLAYKAYEIEELADLYFFRPLGGLIARAARFAGLTPNQLTVGGCVIGVAAGSLLYDEQLGMLAFALLIVHSIVDSADGQLARMTGQESELGRVLDGIGGYMTHAAVYVAILAGFIGRGGGLSLIGWAVLSAIANTAHAQLYDYHRASYATIAIAGEAPPTSRHLVAAAWARRLVRAYEAMQRRLIGLHGEVEEAVAARARYGKVPEVDRARYRASFYWPVRGWNLLGDNTRFYAIGVLAWIHHLEWFFAFILIPMNIALAALWLWQRRADRQFLVIG